jgi:putative FmdB family regulatory protein
MPTYDYLCPACGAFSAVKPIARYQEPEPCPTCASPAPRAILKAPSVNGASGGGGWLAGLKRHAGGCSCY